MRWELIEAFMMMTYIGLNETFVFVEGSSDSDVTNNTFNSVCVCV